jgi:hypothetical protein
VPPPNSLGRLQKSALGCYAFSAKISLGQGGVISRDIFSCGGRHERELTVRRRVRAVMVEELAAA